MTAKRTLWGTVVSVGVGEEGGSVGVPVADGVEVGRIKVGEGISLGVWEGRGVAVGRGGSVVKLQAASRKAHIAEMTITQPALCKSFPGAITILTRIDRFVHNWV